MPSPPPFSQSRFKKLAKRDYGNVKMTLSDKELEKFPVIHFVFQDSDGAEVVVHCAPSAYLEHQVGVAQGRCPVSGPSSRGGTQAANPRFCRHNAART